VSSHTSRDMSCDWRIQQLEGALLSLGYGQDMLLREYRFLAGEGAKAVVCTADLAAFGDRYRHDLDTCCIAGMTVGPSDDCGQVVRRLAYLAPPVALLAGPTWVEAWAVRGDGRAPSCIGKASYGRLSGFVNANRWSLGPDVLLAAKRGSRQLSFFEADPTLLDFARSATATIVTDAFRDAVAAGREALAGTRRPVAAANATMNVAKLAIRVLAARILEDKGYLGKSRAATGLGLLRKAHAKLPRYFGGGTVEPAALVPAVEAIWDRLALDTTFRSLTNEMLGSFYERAFVTPELRADLGVYYTPRPIAHRMLQRMPVEDIPPAERHVFDGTCGSGSFLVAAHERLDELLPADTPADRRHEYMLRHLWGMDLDGFAVEVAGLSLLNFSLPAGDSWHVTEGSLLAGRPRQLAARPSIIVGNPPWGEDRARSGRYHQRATDYLAVYLRLLAPGGLLGVVLPEAFLQSTSCREARQLLLEECDILEMWQLPATTFERSSVESVAIMARRRHSPCPSDRPSPVRVERFAGPVSQPALQSYMVDATDDFARDPHSAMVPRALAGVWRGMRTRVVLGDVASVFNAVQPGPGREERFAQHKLGPNWLPCLRGATDLEPYALARGRPFTGYVDYPSDLRWPRIERSDDLRRPKVITNADRAMGNPWRLYAAVDTEGVLPVGHLNCVVPLDHADPAALPVLAAVLNGPVANAWVDETCRTRNLNLGMLRRTPVPEFSAAQKRTLCRLVGKVVSAKSSGALGASDESKAAVRHLVQQIDELVIDAYGLPSGTRERLCRLFGGFPRPGREREPEAVRHDPQQLVRRPSERVWRVVGSTVDVDVPSQAVFVWIRGIAGDDPVWVAAWGSMPGWALQPGAYFEADVPWDERHERDAARLHPLAFRPLEFGYLSDDELARHVAAATGTGASVLPKAPR
jgi:hypothetical protein